MAELFRVRRYDGWFLEADVGAIDVEMCWSPSGGGLWDRARAEALAAEYHAAVFPTPELPGEESR